MYFNLLFPVKNFPEAGFLSRFTFDVSRLTETLPFSKE